MNNSQIAALVADTLNTEEVDTSNWVGKRAIEGGTVYRATTPFYVFRIIKSFHGWSLYKHEVTKHGHAIQGKLVDSGWDTAKEAKIDANRFYID